MAGKKKTPKAAPSQSEKVQRLTPKPEVLRALYLLSGNNCAIPGCNNVIIDHAGAAVGHVCHIEAAMPDGARFNAKQTNEERRALSNLILICAGHHEQIDSKKHEDKYTVAALRKIKADHEKRFRGLDNSLEQAFKNSYVDSTDALKSTAPTSFASLEAVYPACKLRDEDEEKQRKEQLEKFCRKMELVPQNEREFMAGVIRRAKKLQVGDQVSVHVNDIKSTFGIGHAKIKSLGEALARYGVGCVDLVGTDAGDEPHVMLRDPSKYLGWLDIAYFCEMSEKDLDEFVLRLKFALLD